MLTDYLPQFETQLTRTLTCAAVPTKLNEAMRYVCLNGGKRLRPLLVYAIGESLGVTTQHLHAPACAVELIHCYSLVHDDLPAMDNDDLRRGKLSCHKAFDEATAILVGDALQSLAYELLDDIKMVHALAKATGAAGMVGGQLLDMQYQQGATHNLQQIHLLKTAKLFAAAATMAAMAAKCDAQQTQALGDFALDAGLLFQIHDDMADGEKTLNTNTLKKSLCQQAANLSLKNWLSLAFPPLAN